MKKILTTVLISRFIFVFLATILVTYLLFLNFAPFGFEILISNQNENEISSFKPKERVEKLNNNGELTYKQKGNLIYFDTSMPFDFDEAEVTIVYKNESGRDVSLGFKDKPFWHYNTKILDSPILNTIKWISLGDGPYLYQKNYKYSTFSEFVKDQNRSMVVGTYKYDPSLFYESTKIEQIREGSNSATIVNVPLRGKHTMYSYLHNQPFQLLISKEDLNWYHDPDPITVTIYKGSDVVFSVNIEDDGIIDDSKTPGPEQSIRIKNPGPGLPEDGIYKIVIDATSDTLITRIETNLQKLIFEGPVFLAGNSRIYKSIERSTPTTIYTNSYVIGAKTLHPEGVQKIHTDQNDELVLEEPAVEKVASLSGNLTKLTIPLNDVILRSVLGYFSFDPGHFFNPTNFKIVPITDLADIQIADYIVTDYQLPEVTNGWNKKTLKFNLTNAVIENGKLSWVLNGSELEETNSSIIIGGIYMKLIKKPSIKI